MITLHHVHLMSTNLPASIAFWVDHFGGRVIQDTVFAGARNVFLQVGEGRIHFYEQSPRTTDRGVVHHLGIQTDELETLVERLRLAEISVTEVRRNPTANYAMASGPDNLLIELFEPNTYTVSAELQGYFFPQSTSPA